MKRVLAVAALIGSPAFAQNLGAEQAPEVERVVVTAERSERPLYQTPVAITVIGRELLEQRQAVVVSDILAQTPGVSVNRNGGVGAATAVRIRGAEAEHTAVLIDGVKLNDPASPGGGFDFGNLLVGDIARIEVLRGPQSVLWGSQAIGGVVNLLTEPPRAGFSAQGAAEAGARETTYARVATGYGGERYTVRLAAGGFTTQGVSAFRDGTEADGFRSAHVSARADVSLTEALGLDLRAYRASSHSDIDGFPPPAFGFVDTAEFSDVDETVAYVGLALRADAARHRLGYAFTAVDRANTDRSSPHPTTFASSGRNGRLEYQSVLDRDRWRATFGAEHERSDIEVFALERDARLDSVYAQASLQAAGGLTLTAGLRHDEHDRFGGRTTGQAGLAWVFEETVLRANWGQGFKAPSLFQLYSDFGNEALGAETAEGFDVGFEHRIGPVRVSATVFGRRTDDQVDFFSCFGGADARCATRPFGFYENLGETRAHGLELSGDAALARLTLSTTYTFLDAQNRDSGRALARRPRHALYAAADYLWPSRLATGVSLQYVGERFDDAANRIPLDAYVLVDLRAAYPVTAWAELYGRIENLTDQTYESTRLYGAPGRGAFVGVRSRF